MGASNIVVSSPVKVVLSGSRVGERISKALLHSSFSAQLKFESYHFKDAYEDVLKTAVMLVS